MCVHLLSRTRNSGRYAPFTYIPPPLPVWQSWVTGDSSWSWWVVTQQVFTQRWFDSRVLQMQRRFLKWDRWLINIHTRHVMFAFLTLCSFAGGQTERAHTHTHTYSMHKFTIAAHTPSYSWQNLGWATFSTTTAFSSNTDLCVCQWVCVCLTEIWL